tara:strand:- start:8841 stop:9128 length:288 start_codon:yes stop_codon:yes gene_type:complete
MPEIYNDLFSFITFAEEMVEDQINQEQIKEKKIILLLGNKYDLIEVREKIAEGLAREFNGEITEIFQKYINKHQYWKSDLQEALDKKIEELEDNE